MKATQPCSAKRALITDISIIAAFTAIYAAVNIYWPHLHQMPPEGDYAFHFVEAAAFHNALSHTNLAGGIITSWIWPSSYPPGLYIITYLWTLFSGITITNILTSQVLLIPLLTASLYYLVRPRCGIIAGIASMLSAGADYSLSLITDQYMLDSPQTVFTLLGLCLLINFSNFKNRGAALALGISIGFGTLVKYTLSFYLAVPMLILVFKALREEKPKFRYAFWHVLAFLAAISIPKLLPAYYPISSPESLFFGGTVYDKGVFKLLTATIDCWFVWIFIVFILRKKVTAAITNISLILSSAYIIAAPWFFCNPSVVSSRSEPLMRQVIGHFEPDALMLCARQYYKTFPGIFLLMLLVTALVYAFTKKAHAADKLIAISMLTASPVLYLMLGESPRYIAPSFILSMTLIISMLSRTKLGNAIAISIMGTLMYWNMIDPVICGEYYARNGTDIKYGYQRPFIEFMHIQLFQYQQKIRDFNAAQLAAPNLTLKDRPSIVLICFDINQTDVGTNLSYGFQAWTEMNGSRIVPILYRPGKLTVDQAFSQYIPRLVFMLQKEMPQLKQLLRNDRQIVKITKMLPSGHADFIVDPIEGASVKPSVHPSASEAEELLGGQASYEDVTYGKVKLRIWKKKLK